MTALLGSSQIPVLRLDGLSITPATVTVSIVAACKVAWLICGCELVRVANGVAVPEDQCTVRCQRDDYSRIYRRPRIAGIEFLLLEPPHGAV